VIPVLNWIARRLRRSTDEGYVLAVVLGLGLVMIILVTTSVAVTSSGEQKAHTEANWNAALSAAFAGVEDYKSRVENDTGYSRYGNPAAPFSVHSTNLQMPTGASANAAFTATAGGAWAEVPGSDDPNTPEVDPDTAYFRYEVDNSRFPSTGVLRIRATGKVGESTRSVIADLKQNGFNDYVYYTKFEVQDPAVSGENVACGNYDWIRASSCVDIQFGPNDVLRGKVHSNDRILVCSSHFMGGVSTASQSTPLYAIATGNGCTDATFDARKPQPTAVVEMPDTNSEMRTETRNDLPVQVPNPGCLYTGPTSITMNNDGTMTVISPFTQFTNIAATSAGKSNPSARCGAPGTAAGQLGNAAGAIVPVPNDNLVYVQTVPGTSTDANYTAVGTWPTGFTCNNRGTADEGWTFGTVATTLTRYPIVNEDRPLSSTSTTPAYGCRSGDLYLKGVVKGKVTLGAENFVYITGNVTYNDNRADMIGIVGQNALWIWNPMDNIVDNAGVNNDSGTAMLGTGRTIYGSLLSVAHTIQVQNYQVGGSRGTLKIVGSMAQKFRGTVGIGSTGFTKDYGYDDRLTYTSPPKFLAPTSTTFDSTQIAGVPPAYRTNGAPR
jgi:hypothetical protein